MAQVDLAGRPDRENLRQPGFVDMEECVRSEVFGDTDPACPGAITFLGHGDVFGPDADRLRVVLLGFGSVDQVHLWAIR